MANSTSRRVDLTQKVPVRIRSIFNAGKGALLNVSSAGAYVATPMFLLPQARVKLQIVLREERRWVEAEAVVVWENRGTIERRDNLPPGYGLRFVVLPKDTEAVLEDLLSGDGHLASPEPALAPEPPGQPSSADTPASRTSAPPLAASFDAEPEGPPYRLRGEHVERHTPEAQAGIFVLSYDRTQEARVGRADTDLRSAIAGSKASTRISTARRSRTSRSATRANASCSTASAATAASSTTPIIPPLRRAPSSTAPCASTKRYPDLAPPQLRAEKE